MAYVKDSDEEQEEEEGMLLACILVSESYIPSNITEAAISGHSVLCNIIVQELAQRDLERPTFN